MQDFSDFSFSHADNLNRLQEMVQEHPHVPELRASLAGGLWGAGRMEEALAEMSEVVREMPEANVLAVFGQMLAAAGRPDEAWEALQRAVALEPENSGVRLCAGNLLHQRGRRNEARAEWTEALGIERRLREAWPPGREKMRETARTREARHMLDTYPAEED